MACDSSSSTSCSHTGYRISMSTHVHVADCYTWKYWAEGPGGCQAQFKLDWHRLATKQEVETAKELGAKLTMQR